jgi:hypothetical protein
LEVDRLYQAAAFPIQRAPVEIIPVLPQQRLDGLFGDFQPTRSRQLLELGRQDARRVLTQLKSQGKHD